MERQKGAWIRRNWKRYLVTLILLLVLFGMAAGTYWRRSSMSAIDYAASLDKVAAVVNGNKLTLRDLAFYVAYEEDQVQQQALIYSPDDPKDYWNSKLNGIFIYHAASNAAIRMAMHDELFYQMALSEEITLSQEDERVLEENLQDFWTDLEENGRMERLGVEKEDIRRTMERIVYAQKMQVIYAALMNLDYEDYDFSGEEYQRLLESQDYEIKKNVWQRVHMGNVTLE